MPNKKTPKPAPTVHLYVLLDRSGSMSAMADDVIGGFEGSKPAEEHRRRSGR